MLRSIGKFSKSFLIKLLVGIIILPFIFWGMGDIFRGGSQNVVAKIDNQKISSQEFVNYLNRLDLDDSERKNLKNTDLVEKILSEYISKKILDLEIKKYRIMISDTSLRDIIINDDFFYKDKKFSRVEYEKFLLKNNLSAPLFEQNISEQEKKRQLLSYLSGGVKINDFMVEREFRRDNQIKKIKYISLKKIYENYNPSTTDKEKVLKENKDFFIDEFKSLKFIEITPESLVGNNEYTEKFFQTLDEIENLILDGKKIEFISNNFKLNIEEIKEVNDDMKILNGDNVKNIDKQLFSKIFNIKEIDKPELIKINKKYYIGNIAAIKKVSKSLKDKSVDDIIITQLKIKKIIEENSKIRNDILSKKFNLNKMNSFADAKGLVIKNLKIDKLEKVSEFSKPVIKEIFKTRDKEFNLISENNFSNNYIVYTEETKYKDFDKNNKDYELYKTRAKLNYANDIFKIYDKSVNKKYKVEFNNKTINRIKNSF